MDDDLLGGLSDEELVQRVQCGNHSAFNKLYAKYWPLVYAVVLKKVRNREDAQDIGQETFLKAYQKASTLQQPRSFQAWLLQTACNAAIDWLRKKKRTAQPTDASGVEASTESPAELLSRDEQIRAALQQLRISEPVIYEVVILHAQGYSLEEIAQRLHLRVSTVRTYLSKGRKMLRRAISRKRPPKKKKSRLFSKKKHRKGNDQQHDERPEEE